jgi:hypothetical protein
VLQHLYLDTGRADDPGAIPEALREPLAEQALAAGEFQRALRLISGLEPPPATLDGIELRLRRARIRVLSGDQERGTAELTLLLDTFPEVFAEQPDRMLAVIENLRGRGAHGPAIALLQRWLPALDLEARHDLHLLIAASELARNRPLPAARHFLLAEAAGSADGPAHDYRRQAVRALLRAGLFNDARQLLEGELAATSDAARRAAIERELRSLR